MENNLMVFENIDFGKLKVIMVEEKEYFDANEVAKILGYARPNDTIRNRCKGTIEHSTLKNEGGYALKCIPEGDLYRLIISSQLPSADKFERWVFDEVLPSLRKRGVYIMEHAKEEVIDNEKLFGKRRIKNTFANAKPSELIELYERFIAYIKTEYTPKERISMFQNAYAGLSQLSVKLANDVISNMGKCYEISLLQSRILQDKAELQNRVNGGIKSSQTKTIKKLNPPLEDYMVFNIHPMSENYMYEPVKNDTTGKPIMVKTYAYNKWLKEFPRHKAIQKEDMNIDWDKPLEVFMKFDCLEKFDPSNLIKSSLDMVITHIYGVDDKQVKNTIQKVNDYVTEYDNGKIYIYIQNV